MTTSSYFDYLKAYNQCVNVTANGITFTYYCYPPTQEPKKAHPVNPYMGKLN